jgi:hypothetical protein
MTYRKFYPIIVVILLFNLMAACTQATPGVPTEAATGTPVPVTPSKTAKPTSTPRPTVTPNLIETQSYDDLFSEVQKYKDEGLIPTTKGQYTVLDDYNEAFAMRGFLNYQYFGFTVKNFVYKAHVEWSTADTTSETSGCGIVFAVQQKGDNNDYYGVVLDKSRIYFSTTYGGYYYDMGKSRGTGKLNFGNPAVADFTLVVFDYKAFVYVDNEFIGEYTLSKDRELSGKFGYGIISGTNHDYGTRCKITNSRIWKLNPNP